MTKTSDLIYKYNSLRKTLSILKEDLLNENLPAISDIRLAIHEAKSIDTIDRLLEQCVDNLKEELKYEENK